MISSSNPMSKSQDVYIIAEACENHLGNIDTAIKMINLSKRAGANAVKFQHHLREHEMKRGLAMSTNFDEDLYDFLGRCSLTLDQHIVLKDECDKIGIDYLCTPFCLEAAKELVDANLVKIVKIGSGELLDFRMHKYLIDNNIGMILSTGMSTESEIEEAYTFLKSQQANFQFMHCVSEYPPNYQDINLNYITRLINKFPDTTIGFSCHTPTLYTCYGAVSLGAKIIEKHVIIDKSVKCPDQSVSIDFVELSELCKGIRILSQTYGETKEVFDAEKQVRSWARRILVAKQDINVGDIFTSENLTTMRAGDGISSKYYFDYLNNKATVSCKQNQPIVKGAYSK